MFEQQFPLLGGNVVLAQAAVDVIQEMEVRARRGRIHLGFQIRFQALTAGILFSN